jgi:hypothetical protein
VKTIEVGGVWTRHQCEGRKTQDVTAESIAERQQRDELAKVDGGRMGFDVEVKVWRSRKSDDDVMRR